MSLLVVRLPQTTPRLVRELSAVPLLGRLGKHPDASVRSKAVVLFGDLALVKPIRLELAITQKGLDVVVELVWKTRRPPRGVGVLTYLAYGARLNTRCDRLVSRRHLACSPWLERQAR